MLVLLILGPFSGQQPFSEALLAVEASHVTADDDSAQTAQHGGNESSSGQPDVDKARKAARQLLAEQRDNLGMWAAYAGLESKAGQHKVRLPHLDLISS